MYSLTRTESGSFINQYSKQPTPAPSSPGGHDYDMDGNFPPSSPQHDNPFTVSHGLATPSSSVPYDVYVRGREDSDNMVRVTCRVYTFSHLTHLFQEGVFREGSPLTPLQSPRELEPDDGTLTHDLHLAELEDQLQQKSDLLAAKDVTLVAEQTRVQELQRAVAELESSCVEKDTTIVGIEKLLDNAEALASTLRSDLEVRQAQYNRELDELRASAASYQVQAEDEKRRADTATGDLTRQEVLIAKVTKERDALQNDYDDMQEILLGLRIELMDARNALTESSTLHYEAQQLCSQADFRISELSEQVSSLQAELESTVAAQQGALAQNVALEQRLTATLAITEALRVSLSTTSLSLEQSKAAKDALEAELVALHESCANDAKLLESVQAQSDNFKATGDTLQANLDTANDRIQSLTLQIQQLQAIETALKASRDEALGQIDTLRAEAVSTQVKLAELELTKDELTYRLQVRDDELALLRADVQEKVALHASLNDQLSSLQTKHATLEQHLAEKAEELQALQTNVATLRSTEANLRMTLDAEMVQSATERADHTAEMVLLKASMQSWESQAKEFAANAEDARQTREATVSELQVTQEQLDGARQDLADARTQIASFRHEIEVARTRVVEAQREIDDLRSMKTEDEKKIRRMQDAFATLREAQSKAFAEVEIVVRDKKFCPNFPVP